MDHVIPLLEQPHQVISPTRAVIQGKVILKRQEYALPRWLPSPSGATANLLNGRNLPALVSTRNASQPVNHLKVKGFDREGGSSHRAQRTVEFRRKWICRHQGRGSLTVATPGCSGSNLPLGGNH
jgi:hypothetical protein